MVCTRKFRSRASNVSSRRCTGEASVQPAGAQVDSRPGSFVLPRPLSRVPAAATPRFSNARSTCMPATSSKPVSTSSKDTAIAACAAEAAPRACSTRPGGVQRIQSGTMRAMGNRNLPATAVAGDAVSAKTRMLATEIAACRLRRREGAMCRRSPVSTSVRAMAARASSGNAASSPIGRAPYRKPACQASTVHAGHKASRPNAFATVRSAIRAHSSGPMFTGSVTSHSRSQSTCASSLDPSGISTAASVSNAISTASGCSSIGPNTAPPATGFSPTTFASRLNACCARLPYASTMASTRNPVSNADPLFLFAVPLRFLPRLTAPIWLKAPVWLNRRRSRNRTSSHATCPAGRSGRVIARELPRLRWAPGVALSCEGKCLPATQRPPLPAAAARLFPPRSGFPGR